MIALFYDRVKEDAMLAPLFANMDPQHASFVAQFIIEVFGGPPVYSGEHGGHAHMIARHLGRLLTEEQRRRWVNLLFDCADETGLPNDPEFRSAFVAYIEWGTRLAVLNSQTNDPPDPSTPMPKWDWGVPGGPYS